jgi:hypothetical protein
VIRKISSLPIFDQSSYLRLMSVSAAVCVKEGTDVQYQGWDADQAVADYWSRIRDQQTLYETVTAEEGPFIKVMNVGERIEVNRIEGEPCEHSFFVTIAD